MDVVVSDQSRDFAAALGGVVSVRSHAHRCCCGALTPLDTTTERPEDSEDFVAVSPGDPTVRSLGDPAAGPAVLTVERRGTLRRHLVSYWDGGACKL